MLTILLSMMVNMIRLSCHSNQFSVSLPRNGLFMHVGGKDIIILVIDKAKSRRKLVVKILYILDLDTWSFIELTYFQLSDGKQYCGLPYTYRSAIEVVE